MYKGRKSSRKANLIVGNVIYPIYVSWDQFGLLQNSRVIAPSPQGLQGTKHPGDSRVDKQKAHVSSIQFQSFLERELKLLENYQLS